MYHCESCGRWPCTCKHIAPVLRVIEKHEPREYSLLIHDGGIALCDKREGALMCFRFAEDVERLRELLATIDIQRLPQRTE